MTRILAGDIGGTNTRLSVWEADPAGDVRQLVAPTRYKNAEHASLDVILQDYVKSTSGLTDACFGVAGPVDGRRVRMTNIAHWPELFADEIANRLLIPEMHRVNLINDMPAHSASLATIVSHFPEKLVAIRAGFPRANGARAIVMPGTGLGIGGLIWDSRGNLHRPIPTESGHMDLHSRDEAEDKLIRSFRKLLAAKGDPVTREHVISGPGLRAMYACLKSPDAPNVESAPKSEELLKLEARDPIARQTLDMFTSFMGSLCANTAFALLATGGVFVAGGIANSLRGRLESSLFLDAVDGTGPRGLRDLVQSIPIYLVTYEDTGLLGAATYATWAAQKRI